MTILDKIIENKYKETEERKSLYPVKLLERSIFFSTKPVSLKYYLQREELSGIIAEFKRKSPSKGMINEYAKIDKISIGYMRGGASALSVLTDKDFFGGSSKDLEIARQLNYCPILRKDFIIDEYQIIESKSIGADVILLIAAVLDENKIIQLAKTAKSLGLEVILEIHSEDEIKKIHDCIDIVGVNNRDLNTFDVNVETSVKLSSKITDDFIKISESGISNPETIIKLKGLGYKGFLIGETFMKTANPEDTCASFVRELKCYSKIND
jgi:indole-3-glycerol phosphate synthase